MNKEKELKLLKRLIKIVTLPDSYIHIRNRIEYLEKQLKKEGN